MAFDFAFKFVQTTREIRKTIDYLTKQDLGYPFYDNWVQKVEGNYSLIINPFEL